MPKRKPVPFQIPSDFWYFTRNESKAWLRAMIRQLLPGSSMAKIMADDCLGPLVEYHRSRHCRRAAASEVRDCKAFGYATVSRDKDDAGDRRVINIGGEWYASDDVRGDKALEIALVSEGVLPMMDRVEHMPLFEKIAVANELREGINDAIETIRKRV